ncbi:DNA-binding transcriptional regulator [Telmatospirillum sp.]|uniref:XylR family transcriptional regulator n=1 Tax=Telmatospirillum sp. TaxID=2079197 RepID=UPI00285222A1|nr:DNA-binding transcriptional regulator [Telmatospirillum sp.]MDR3438762.1 DNA-binding transcriptional regulator [Telmatospirillum sp.]
MNRLKQKGFRVALFLKTKGGYGREIVTGICDYLRSTRLIWDMLLHEDFRCSPEGIRSWTGDGIIADFDDPEIEAALRGTTMPVVAVGGSYHRRSDYPKGMPYVATDNQKLVEAAFQHLVEMGLSRFALYSMPPLETNRWALEREKAYSDLIERDGLEPAIFRGRSTYGPDWDAILGDLVCWLKSLPKPIGVIAVSDARARQVLQACIVAAISVPEEVALVGIDNDPLLKQLTRISISSVRQGTCMMGLIAAELLHRRLLGEAISNAPVLVPPEGISAQISSRHEPVYDPYVMRALHYIRQFTAQGVKVAQVADYVGVSRTTLETHFRKQFGHSVHEEMLDFKLRMAKDMLAAPEASCADVAGKCGFTSLQYMYAVFRREVGCTPRQFQLDRDRRLSA